MSSSDTNKITILLLLKNLQIPRRTLFSLMRSNSSRGLMLPVKAKLSQDNAVSTEVTEELMLPVELTPILAAKENNS